VDEMKDLKQIIESVLNDVHIESGRKDEYERVVMNLELAISSAINNHDRLVEENAELREILKKLIGNGIDLLNVDDVEDEEDAASIHAKFNDVVNEAGALLAKKPS
jgi:hypothetical protein